MSSTQGHVKKQQEIGEAQIIIGDDSDRNPLKKLLAGFCDPFVYQDDEEKTVKSPEDSPKVKERKYNPDLTTQTTSTTTTTATKSRSLDFEGDAPVDAFENVEVSSDAGNGIRAPADSSANSSIDDIPCDEHPPELHVVKTVTRMRRKRGIEVFLMSCVFLLGTIVTLRRLGFTLADFHAPSQIISEDTKQWISVQEKKTPSNKDNAEQAEQVNTAADSAEFLENEESPRNLYQQTQNQLNSPFEENKKVHDQVPYKSQAEKTSEKEELENEVVADESESEDMHHTRRVQEAPKETGKAPAHREGNHEL